MSAQKLPRIDLRKLTSGTVASRRETVAVLGDALREQAAVRIEGHGTEVDDVAALAVVADHLLEALAEYFGLPSRAFVDAAGTTRGAAGSIAVAAVMPGALLVLLPEPPATAEVRGDGRWTAAAARPGELMALAGGALATLTAQVVPAAVVRWSGVDGVRGIVIAAAADPDTLRPLPHFAPRRPAVDSPVD